MCNFNKNIQRGPRDLKKDLGGVILKALKYIVIAGITYVAATAISTLKRKQPKIHYYKAKRINAKVYI